MTDLPRGELVGGVSVAPVAGRSVPIDPARMVSEPDREIAEKFVEDFSALWR